MNTDSGLSPQIPDFKFLENFELDKTNLWPALSESRSIKTEKEILLLDESARITQEAHKQVMKRAEPGMKEY